MIKIEDLEKVIGKTIEAVEKGKEDLYRLEDDVRKEYDRCHRQLLDIRIRIDRVIEEVDRLEVESRKLRNHLMIVNRDFHRYSKEAIKEAYDEAHEKMLELMQKRETEKILRLQRDHLEQNMKTLENARKRSEELMSTVSMALKLLTNDLSRFFSQMGEVQTQQSMGLSIIRAQEEERKRVARDIHDGPAQSLANIVMRAEFCMKLMEVSPEKVSGELEELMELVRNSLGDVRKIIFDLRPMSLDDLGLLSALKRYTEQYSETFGIHVEISVIGSEKRFDNSIEIGLFRVIQEALTNVQKHTNSDEVVIKIEFMPKKLNVLIRDNGQGFDPEQVEPENESSGYGIMGMKERVQLMKGTINIKSQRGNGTQISVSVPIEAGDGNGSAGEKE
ncbi:MAG: histidine kinase [Tindallia sp. MSAO_Bac2]|nr:MAG: histidine kinase [Tindallia sp. MSAO_Bac2]